MKKLMLICLVLVSAKSFSQSIFNRLEFGLKAGANASNFTNANFPTDPLIGFHGGATVAFKITNNFLIQEEFLFSTQGAKIKGGTLGDQSRGVLECYECRFGVGVRLGTREPDEKRVDIGCDAGFAPIGRAQRGGPGS